MDTYLIYKHYKQWLNKNWQAVHLQRPHLPHHTVLPPGVWYILQASSLPGTMLKVYMKHFISFSQVSVQVCTLLPHKTWHRGMLSIKHVPKNYICYTAAWLKDTTWLKRTLYICLCIFQNSLNLPKRIPILINHQATTYPLCWWRKGGATQQGDGQVRGREAEDVAWSSLLKTYPWRCFLLLCVVNIFCTKLRKFRHRLNIFYKYLGTLFSSHGNLKNI